MSERHGICSETQIPWRGSLLSLDGEAALQQGWRILPGKPRQPVYDGYAADPAWFCASQILITHVQR
ncbi:hypothetical protein J3P85_28665 [Pseudomonas sp. Z1-12]|uniref:hypothetical protein n=1 Tax=Pseudomonas sp. Z1-12 TaxID=2817408 RepID=UPI003DA7B3BD